MSEIVVRVSETVPELGKKSNVTFFRRANREISGGNVDGRRIIPSRMDVRVEALRYAQERVYV